MTASALKLGHATNLLNGYKPTFDPNDTPYYLAPNQGFNLEDPQPSGVGVTDWEGPNITLCASPEDLITALYKYVVVKGPGDVAPPGIPSGPLVLDDADRTQAIAAIKEFLGIDLSQADGGYALVQINRSAGSASYSLQEQHSFLGTYLNQELIMSRETGQALVRLRPGKAKSEAWMTGKVLGPDQFQQELTVAEVQSYFDFFNSNGTHFVSKVYFGDFIFQVFAYSSTDFASISQFYQRYPNQLSGDLAVNFQLYTNPKNGQFGYATQVGKLLIQSQDPVFAQDVQNGDWTDSAFNIASIFAPFVGTKVDLTTYQVVVPTGFELTDIASYAQLDRRSNARQLFKAAVLTKYGSLVQPNFNNQPAYDYDTIFPQQIEGFVSTLATPILDIYKERLDLGDVQLMAAADVQSFTVMTQVMQLNGSALVQIPGDDVLLAAHVFDFSAGNLPQLQLTDAAFASLQLACQDFNGPLTLVNTSGTAQQTIVDGFRYKLAPSTQVEGRDEVVLVDTVCTPFSATMLTRLETDIEFSLTAADIILNARSSSDLAGAQQLILKYLNWLGLNIPGDVADSTLQEYKVRALYMARVGAKLNLEGIEVPYLKYATYLPIVSNIKDVLQVVQGQISSNQAQIDARKLEELTIDVGTALNQNIIQSGKLLSGFIGTMAQQQSDLATYYGQIITQQQTDLAALEQQQTNLAAKLNEQQNTVNQLVEAYKTAVADWEQEQIIQFSLDVATSVFTLGVDLATPAAEFSALKSLGETAQMIQKAITVFNDLGQMYKTLSDMPQAAATLSNIGYDGTTFPSELQWDEFSVNMQTCLGQGPSIPAKDNLSAGFQILVLRGKALLTLQAQMQQAAGDVYLNQKRQQLSQAQQQRLDALNTNLQPASVPQLDTSAIDLLGLTGSYQTVQNQMLAMLARTLAIQDSALQYEYLQPPTAITEFDLVSLYQVILAQSQKIVSGLNNIQPPPAPFTPITYTIQGIPVGQLTNGNAFQFMIPLSAKEFFNYAMVRADRVVASVGSLPTTTGGDFLLSLIFNGTPFDDRDQNRQPVTYHTRQREFDFLYDATGQALFGDSVGSWASQISDITPFSQWLLSFPNDSVNQGIAFAGKTVDITLTFYGEALLRAPQPRAASRKAFAAALPAADLAMVEDVALPTVAQIVQQMNQVGTVMRGWDVVLNLSQDKVNSILQQQWTDRANNPDFFYQIPLYTYFSEESPTTTNRTVTQFQLTLGTPLITFLDNNPQNVQLQMNIESGTYSFGVVTTGLVNNMIKNNLIPAQYVADFQSTNAFSLNGDISALLTALTDNYAVAWQTQNQTISQSDNDSLTATVPLSQVGGQIAGVSTGNLQSPQNVYLDVSKGAFTNQDMVFAQNNPDIDIAIENYMSTNDIRFVINVIDKYNHAALAALTPNLFAFNTLIPDGDGAVPVLQIFISTGQDSLQSNRGINLNNPLPLGTDASLDVSLMINSQIFFQDIFVQSINSQSGYTAAAVAPPAGTTQSYSAQLTVGTVSGTMTPTDQVRISGNSNQINISLASMTFTPASSGILGASYNGSWTQGFQYLYCPSAPPCGMAPPCEWDDASLGVSLTISFPMPIQVGTGAGGQDQTIQISSSPASILINGSLDEAGPCKCNDRDVQQAVLTNLQTQLPTPISNAVNISFNPISVFALDNLLFPASKLQLSSAFVPGDLVIFGSISAS